MRTLPALQPPLEGGSPFIQPTTGTEVPGGFIEVTVGIGTIVTAWEVPGKVAINGMAVLLELEEAMAIPGQWVNQTDTIGYFRLLGIFSQ